MKCGIMLHFNWVFTVCQSIHLRVSSIQRVKDVSINRSNQYRRFLNLSLFSHRGWRHDSPLDFLKKLGEGGGGGMVCNFPPMKKTFGVQISLDRL